MGLPFGDRAVRIGIPYLRCCAQLSNFDHWTSDCWFGCIWHLLRCYDDLGPYYSTSSETYVFGSFWRRIWRIICRWTASWWGFYRKLVAIIVYLRLSRLTNIE